MPFLGILLLTAAVSVTVAQVPSLGTCPTVTTKPGFDVNQYLGKWYEVARYYPMFFEFANKCGIAQYSLKPNGRILVNNTGVKYTTGKSDIAIGEAFVFNPADDTGALQVSFGDFAPNAANYLVLDTDYENFSIVFSCDSLGIVRLDYLWLLGRKPTIPDDILDKIYDLLRSFGIRTKYIKFAEHDCGF